MTDRVVVAGSIFGVNLLPALTDAIGSPLGIALQVAMLAGLVLLVRVDWAARLAHRR